MKTRILLWSGLGIIALAMAAGAGWIVSLPQPSAARTMPPIAGGESEAAIAALRQRKRERPLIAVVGINDATETTDYLTTYGILRRADVADVVALATGAGAVKLYPALKVLPDATIADFDVRHPGGADYVIVPAMSRDDDLAAVQWIKNQAAKGATVISVCAGAKVLANTGLLDGKRATTHWYYLDELLEAHPAVRYVPDRRLVVDGKMATTTSISASMPMMLTLIEAIAGRARAEAVARDLGLAGWDARHDSRAFRFTRPFAMTAMRNMLAFWDYERFGIALKPGVDEVALALVADAWSRTYRSRAVTFAGNAAPQRSANGLRIVPDAVSAGWPAEQIISAGLDRPPAQALDTALGEIAGRYGRHTADLVAMQLEYRSPGTQRAAGTAPSPRAMQ